MGDHNTFYSRDVLHTDHWYRLDATCLYVSPKVAIWIATKTLEQMQDSLPVASIVSRLSDLLENHTPAPSTDPRAGILSIDESNFGSPPDVDGDGQLDILLLNIRDNFAQTGSYVAGFFDPVNLTADPHSNQRDMLYIDLYPALYYHKKIHLKRIASTIAHEYQHLIHANYEGDSPQYTFIDEGLSELAEIVCGFPPRPPNDYFNDPGRPLLSWNYDDPLPGYARASLFMEYLFEQIGFDKIRYLEQTQTRGLPAFRELLRGHSSIKFKQLFTNWGKALLLNDRSSNPAWGYKDTRRDSIRFSPRSSYDELPSAAGGSLPDLVHIPVLFPLTSYLSLQTHSTVSDLQFSAVASYPGREPQIISTTGNTMTASDQPYGSMEVLFSNTHPQKQETDTVTASYSLLARGKKSGVTVTKAYDDGIADVFTGNASYLLLDGSEDDAYAVSFGTERSAWLYAIEVKGIFLNELEGTELPPVADRDLQVQIYSWHHGRPGNALAPPVHHSFKRPLGNLKFEPISLVDEYDDLSALQDSFCVVIRNDSDDGNFFAVGLDDNNPGHTAFFNSGNDRWLPMRENPVGNANLSGWNAMIRAREVVHEQPVTAGLHPQVDVDYRAVTVHLHPSFDIDTTRTACYAVLPSGSITKGKRNILQGISGSDLTFSFPVQTGGKYHFYARMIAGDGRRVSRRNWTWAIPEDREFAVQPNYPNPFNPSTTVPFTLLEDGTVRAEVFNIIGQKIESVSGRFDAGPRHFTIDLSGRASGVYLVQLHLRGSPGHKTIIKTEKIMLIK